MNNKELALLGLLSEGPKYGYQLENDIEARGMREWTEIGFSSIYYLLTKAETQGWAGATLMESEKGPVRKLYALTREGMLNLKNAVEARLANPTPHSGDFDLALAFMPILSEEKISAALARYQQQLESDLERVNRQWEQSGKGQLPPNVDALFTHSLATIQAELDWLTAFIDSRKGNQNGEI
jgi:DNA-binding PadR family transcriptional regulator